MLWWIPNGGKFSRQHQQQWRSRPVSGRQRFLTWTSSRTNTEASWLVWRTHGCSVSFQSRFQSWWTASTMIPDVVRGNVAAPWHRLNDTKQLFLFVWFWFVDHRFGHKFKMWQDLSQKCLKIYIIDNFLKHAATINDLIKGFYPCLEKIGHFSSETSWCENLTI